MQSINLFFQADEKDEGIGMVEAVEKSMDALIKADRNSEVYRRMSTDSQWSKGKSMLDRTRTMNFIKVSDNVPDEKMTKL